MSEDDDNTSSESDILLQGAKSADVGDGDSSAESFENLCLDTDLLRNIPVMITVQVGRTSLPIKTLMQLTQGSVVELDRLAGEALDLLVNNTLVAQGEIVLVNERYGIRLTHIVPKSARLKLTETTNS